MEPKKARGRVVCRVEVSPFGVKVRWALQVVLLLGMAPLVALGCRGENRKIRDLVLKVQVRHGGLDRFEKMATLYAEYDIDDYSTGTPQVHSLILSQQGPIVRSEYRRKDVKTTMVASPLGGMGWMLIEETNGKSQYADAGQREQGLAEIYSYELNSLNVFRLNAYLEEIESPKEGIRTMKCRYEASESPAGFEILAFDIEEFDEGVDLWHSFRLNYIFDETGKLARLEKHVDVPGFQKDTEVRYLDYQDTAGFYVPYRIEYRVGGKLTQIYRVRQYKPQVYFSPEIFLDPRASAASAEPAPSAESVPATEDQQDKE